MNDNERNYKVASAIRLALDHKEQAYQELIKKAQAHLVLSAIDANEDDCCWALQYLSKRGEAENLRRGYWRMPDQLPDYHAEWEAGLPK